MSVPSSSSLVQARELLKKGDAESAKTLLENILSEDLENQEVIFTIRCANYWNERLARILTLPTPFEKAERLISQWKDFSEFISASTIFEQSVYAVKIGVFSMALDFYQSLFNENTGIQKAEVLRKVGLCYKQLGDYETALRFLKDANSLYPDNSPILAEMADCYAFCGEERVAKVLFREAFFIDAQKIDIDYLDSELIFGLIKQVKSKGYKNEALKEWVPVYGVLYGVFSIKRELRAIEVGKLKQAVFSLENELKESYSDKNILTPRLINHYFWLVDYYVNTGDDDRARIGINEVLLKIKLLAPEIHQMYIV